MIRLPAQVHLMMIFRDDERSGRQIPLAKRKNMILPSRKNYRGFSAIFDGSQEDADGSPRRSRAQKMT
jgi:hypothetical protein